MAKKNEKLKPCPFCGEKPMSGSLGNDKKNWAIWCTCARCSVETGINGDTLKEIKLAWNRRTK
jgi:Lar family restriction alleviation protein